MKWRNYVEIRVSGRDLYGFVNALRESPAICIGQHCTGDVFCGCILRRDLETARSIASQRGMELTTQEFHRGRLNPWKFRHRFGLLAGVVLAFALIFYQSNVVETIEITGTHTVDERVILSLLADEGIERGTWIGSIDMFRAEERVRTSLREVAWAGMHRAGNRIVLDISEAREPPEMLRERVPCNIIAAHDAQITGVEVYTGVLCHLLGDGVRKGELLVSGVRTGSNGKSVFLHANAHITGIFRQEAELTTYLQERQEVPTGRVSQRRVFRLFGLQIPLTPRRANYTESRTKTAEMPLQFLGFTLPCAIITETAEELETKEILRTPEEARLALHADIMRYEKNLLGDVTILSRDITYEESDGSITAHLSYQLEGEIGAQSELYMLQ